MKHGGAGRADHQRLESHQHPLHAEMVSVRSIVDMPYSRALSSSGCMMLNPIHVKQLLNHRLKNSVKNSTLRRIMILI